MKIEIEFSSSYEADITIDGRKLKYGYANGVWKFLEGLGEDEDTETIGGMVAVKLSSPLIDILQGWLPDEPNANGDCWGTWEKLSENAAEEVYDRIS